jgi:hypothetical protein
MKLHLSEVLIDAEVMSRQPEPRPRFKSEGKGLMTERVSVVVIVEVLPAFQPPRLYGDER